MLEPLRDQFTIVVVGSWNVAIFSPAWVAENVFRTREVVLEIGAEPGMPRRLTAEDVRVIPGTSRLMVAPVTISDVALKRMAEAVCRILELLNHTPVRGVGVNYGYRVAPLPSGLSSDVPMLLADKLAREDLVVESHESGWSVRYGEGSQTVLNLSVQVLRDEAVLKFNFHSDVRSAAEAIERIKGKVVMHRDKTLSVLDNVFGLRPEE